MVGTDMSKIKAGLAELDGVKAWSNKPGHLSYLFPNGWGVSVINDGYGREQGLYEVAVIDSDGDLNYDTPIAGDVLGWLTEEDVLRVAKEVSELSPEGDQ